MRKFFLVLLFFAPFFSVSSWADFAVDVNSGWQFHEYGSTESFMPATVPGTVHTDLMANGKIPDPFFGTNESKVQWVEEKTWEYQCTFTLTKEQLKEKHLEIQFEGLDTYCEVYMNGEMLFSAEDMFLSYAHDIKRIAKQTNTIRILFHPASELIQQNQQRSHFKDYPGGDRVFIRKAQYQFGWDWGPRLVTCGVWKPVHIEGWSGMHFSDIVYKTDFIEKDTAYMTVDFTFESDKSGLYQFLVFQNDTGIYSDFYRVTGHMPEHLKITFKVPHPKLWWCNGYGKPNLYRFAIGTFRRKKAVVVATVTGIRKIELSSDPVHNDGGFTFILNDVPVFAQGANWIPSDNFIPRITRGKVSSQLTDMRNVNMNMVRVWGGGIYESDYFYSKCDSLGLMVWQDLPFACSMYPYTVLDEEGLLMMEVIDNQRRIASHPSIAMWCGDNENKEGWFNWGWQKQFHWSKEDSASIYNEYQNYSVKFMGCIAKHDGFFPFVSSSPQNGWGRDAAYQHGDVHYWGVWWGMEPFSSYADHTGRFVSEFGFQGAPSIHSFKEMGADVSKWFSNDSTVAAHQKHPTGYETINAYMIRDYGLSPNTFEEYVYASQLLQKDALTTAIEAQRRNYPGCMGSLFWQYNDCWPATSWSVEDYYGRKKLAWYELKRLYQSDFVSIEETDDSVFVWLSVRDIYFHPYKMMVEWTSFTGTKYVEQAVDAEPKKNSCAVYWRESKAKLKTLCPLTDGFMSVRVFAPTGSGADLNLEAHKLFGKAIELNLPDKEVKYSFVRYIQEGPMAITLSSDVYQSNVMIVCDDPNTTFSKNGFDITPGGHVKVEITSTKTERELMESIHFITLNQLVNEEKQDGKK